MKSIEMISDCEYDVYRPLAAKAAFGTSVDYNTTFFDIAEVYESMVLVATKYAELPCMKARSLKCSNCL
ncbi:hypothetical protein Peur_060864 [Populus x canadensis]